jgi:hypothetical protein
MLVVRVSGSWRGAGCGFEVWSDQPSAAFCSFLEFRDSRWLICQVSRLSVSEVDDIETKACVRLEREEILAEEREVSPYLRPAQPDHQLNTKCLSDTFALNPCSI